MARIEIPTTSEGLQEVSVDLDGTVFILTLNYNSRDSFWYLDIKDADGVDIRSGIKGVVNWPLTLGMVEEALPPGDLYFIRTDNTANEILKAELGTDGLLVYEESNT